MKIGLKLTSEMHPFQTTFNKMKLVQYYRLVVFYAVYISCIFLAVAVKTVKGFSTPSLVVLYYCNASRNTLP